MAAARFLFQGAMGFPVTPFRRDLSLSLKALERNVAAMAAHPFCAIVAAGGMGELYSLSPEEIAAVTRVVVRTVAGRVPVLAGIGFNTAIGCALARRLEKAGASGLLVTPPYYTHAPEAGMLAYYRAIGQASGLPLVAYSRDWAVFTPDAVARLAEAVPALAGWKDGQGDTRRLQRIMAKVGDRLDWIGGAGDDCVPAYYAIGVPAFTSSISNFAPALSLELAEAGAAGDFPRLDRLVNRFVHPLFALRERQRGYEVAVTKAAMELLGMSAGPVRPPLSEMRPEDLADLQDLLEKQGIRLKRDARLASGRARKVGK